MERSAVVCRVSRGEGGKVGITAGTTSKGRERKEGKKGEE